MLLGGWCEWRYFIQAQFDCFNFHAHREANVDEHGTRRGDHDGDCDDLVRLTSNVSWPQGSFITSLLYKYQQASTVGSILVKMYKSNRQTVIEHSFRGMMMEQSLQQNCPVLGFMSLFCKKPSGTMYMMIESVTVLGLHIVLLVRGLLAPNSTGTNLPCK